MNEHTLRVLEFDKVRSIVVSCAASEPGRIAATGLLPASDEAAVGLRLKETREFTEILRSGENPPSTGYSISGRQLISSWSSAARFRRSSFFRQQQPSAQDAA